MAAVLVYLFFLVNAILAIKKPWIGIVTAYLFIVMKPQNIWFWHLSGLRTNLYILVPTIIGVIWSIASGKLSPNPFKDKINIYMLLLWFTFALSYFMGPYVEVESRFRFVNAAYFWSLLNKSMFVYFVACLCITTEKSLKWLTVVPVVSTIYMVYWINDQYLFQGMYGRIGGPAAPGGGSLYQDQNAFGMFFVLGMPFLYYMGLFLKKKIFKYGLWLCIPLLWHAIFLTGSRGALLGLGFSTVVIVMRSKRKSIGLLIIPLLLAAFMYQGGDIMKSRAIGMTDYDQESSAVGRLEAWSTAIEMIKDHPLIGVGFTSFGPAFPNYSSYRPREAHNTYFQIAAESGLPAAFLYICIIFAAFKFLLKKKNVDLDINDQFQFYLNESLLASFSGFFICSLFLSVQFYEYFYFLCLATYSLSLLNKAKSLSV